LPKGKGEGKHEGGFPRLCLRIRIKRGKSGLIGNKKNREGGEDLKGAALGNQRNVWIGGGRKIKKRGLHRKKEKISGLSWPKGQTKPVAKGSPILLVQEKHSEGGGKEKNHY